MIRVIRVFLWEQDGQDYIEYLLLAGAAAAVFAAVGARFKNEIISTFEFVIQMLRGARQ
jgi:Flp pilus assembly pilin Flp